MDAQILSYLILFVCALLAFSLSALCGGGASFILIPLLGLSLPGAQIPASLSIGTASSSISRIILFVSNIQWKIVLWFVPAAIPAVWLGAKLLTYLNPAYLELVLALFLLSNIPMIFRPATPVTSSNKKVAPIVVSVMGLLTGFVSGLTGAVGLLFNRFYLRYGLSKEQIIATRAANELLLHLLKLGIYITFGLLTTKVISYGIVVAVAAIASSLSIKSILPYLSEKIFQKIGYTAMVLAGIMMFSNASLNLANQNHLQLSSNFFSNSDETKLQWRSSSFGMEIGYDEGFEIEYSIELNDLTEKQQVFVRSVSKNADKVLLEEVYGFNKHFYEVYVYKNGKLTKYDIA